MTFSRMHIGLLGVVSIFTGIISPVVQDGNVALPFPLTDLQVPAYIILILLAIICILLTVRSWSWVRFFGLLIIAITGYLFIMAWNGEVRSLGDLVMSSISWGWIFIAIGIGLLISCMFGTEDENRSSVSIADHLIGWLSAVTILALTGLVISISYVSRLEYSNNINILHSIFGSGGIENHSGVVTTISFPSIDNLVFDRKYDSISFYTSSGTNMVAIPSGKIYNRLPYATLRIDGIQYNVSSTGIVYTNNNTVIGKAILPQSIHDSILIESGSTIMAYTNTGIRSFTGVYSNISDIVSVDGGEHIAWKSKTASGSYVIYIDGMLQSKKEEDNISNISISPDGSSVMYTTRDMNNSTYIVKNNSRIEKISTGYIEGSLKMNGVDYIYAVEHSGNIELIHNGKLIDRKFDEIREIFLEKSNNSFVYFGRPLGEKTYCLYTTYRGNLCGLNGYMNPILSPDGTSIIYAGLKDEVWGIYRNASPIIRNTGYPNRENISKDYAFFDITNPSYYLFIRHNNEGYQLYTKGSWIQNTWKDIGLDVSFGYNNKIIMSVQDETGWKIIEI